MLAFATDAAMRSRRLLSWRRRTVAGANGRVLEIGIGSGLNLPFYGPGVIEVVGVDPSPRLLARARDRASRMPLKVTLLEGSAECMPLAAASFDSAVVTWTLCSIPDVAAALREIRRLLEPGGHLLFIEHGQAPEGALAAWQDRLTPLWRPLAGGCHLNRRPDRLIADAGFAISELAQGYLVRGPRLLTFHYAGRARAPAAGTGF